MDSPLAGDAATHWLSARAARAPRCALEELAAAIFAFHTRDLRGPDAFEESSSGVEWWVQARPSLKLHWDKDEELRVATGLWVHPQVSTVTYLTGGGSGGTRQAPTVVFEGVVAGPVARGHGGGGGGDDVTSAGSPRANDEPLTSNPNSNARHAATPSGPQPRTVLFGEHGASSHAGSGGSGVSDPTPSIGPRATAASAPEPEDGRSSLAELPMGEDAGAFRSVYDARGDALARAIRDAGSASGTVRVALPPEYGVDVFVVENEGVGSAAKKRRAG